MKGEKKALEKTRPRGEELVEKKKNQSLTKGVNGGGASPKRQKPVGGCPLW